MSRFLILAHGNVWGVTTAYDTIAALSAQGHKCGLIFSRSNERRLNGSGIPGLKNVRRLIEEYFMHQFCPWVDRVSEGATGTLITPNQLVTRYSLPPIEFVPAIGTDSDKGKRIHEVATAFKPDAILSLDTLAQVAPETIKQWGVMGIHPGKLPQTKGSPHAVILAVIHEGGNQVTGTIHQLSPVVDEGRIVCEVIHTFEHTTSLFRIRLELYRWVASVLVDAFVPQIIAGNVKSKEQPKGEPYPKLTEAMLQKHFHRQRPLYKHDELFGLLGQFLPEGISLSHPDLPLPIGISRGRIAQRPNGNALYGDYTVDGLGLA